MSELLPLPEPKYDLHKKNLSELPSKPLITVAMMVKNEEDFLEDCLKSLEGFADELVIVDTGSTDKTVEIAKRYTEKVFFFEWVNDFSAARNETIKHSTGDWIFIIDADERLRIQNPDRALAIQHIKKYLREYQGNVPYDAFMINTINTKLDGSEISSLFNIRIFSNHPHLRYKNRVHNQLIAYDPVEQKECKINILVINDIQLLHFGYDPQVYLAKKKTQRAIPLIEATLQENPDNLGFQFYLGREYLIAGDIQKSKETLEKAFEAAKKIPTEPLYDEILKNLMHCYEVSGYLLKPENLVQMQEILRESVARSPSQPDFWYYLAMVSTELGDSDTAYAAIKNSITTINSFRLEHASQSNPLHLSHKWKIYELAGIVFWNKVQKRESYDAFKIVFMEKPALMDNWGFILRCLYTLALEFKEEDWLTQIAKKAALEPSGLLDHYYIKLQTLLDTKNIPALVEILAWGKDNSERLRQDEQFKRLCAQFLKN